MSTTAHGMDDTHDTDPHAAGTNRDADDASSSGASPVERYFDAVDDRLDDLCETRLQPRFDALDADRLKVRGYIIRAAIVAGIPVVLFILSDYILEFFLPYRESIAVVRYLLDYPGYVFAALVVLAIGIIIKVIALPGFAEHLNYRRRFKQEVVSDIFKMVLPDGAYQPDHHLTQAVVDESRLFSRDYRLFQGDDLMRGRIGSIEFEASEIKAIGRTTEGRKKGNREVICPNLSDFLGMFFHFGLPRTLRGHTIVEPESCMGRHLVDRKGFEQIEFDEDAAFTERFRVYATDTAEARELLDAGQRARLVTFADYLKWPPFLSFVRNHAYVGVYEGKPLLEPTIAQKASYGSVSRIAEFFAMPALLVRELNLDGSSSAGGGAATRFATAATTTPAFGGSILSSPTAGTFTNIDPNTPFTAETILKVAMPEADEKDAALPAPPASRVRLSPLTGEGLDVTYGIPSSFWIRLLWTLGLAPFAIGGVAWLAGPAGAPVFDPIAAQVPMVARMTALIVDWPPIAFIGIVLVFWALPTWGMTHIPRGLQINRQGVTVRRLAWPLRTNVALDRVAGVKVSDLQVMLEKKNASFLRRWVIIAPTMGSKEDARWLGAHCRRALTMFGVARAQ